jgi:hypothetical protein
MAGADGLLHRAAEGHPALELRRHRLGDELRVGVRLADLLHVDDDVVRWRWCSGDARERRRALALGAGLPFFSSSTPLPPLPITMPGRAV